MPGGTNAGWRARARGPARAAAPAAARRTASRWAGCSWAGAAGRSLRLCSARRRCRRRTCRLRPPLMLPLLPPLRPADRARAGQRRGGGGRRPARVLLAASRLLPGPPEDPAGARRRCERAVAAAASARVLSGGLGKLCELMLPLGHTCTRASRAGRGWVIPGPGWPLGPLFLSICRGAARLAGDLFLRTALQAAACSAVRRSRGRSCLRHRRACRQGAGPCGRPGPGSETSHC